MAAMLLCGEDGLTERTIRSLAKELAGKFYEMNVDAEARGEKVHMRMRGRTMQTIEPGLFRKSFPTAKDYIVGRRYGVIQHLPNGVVRWVDTEGRWTQDTPGWSHWYDAARQQLVAMLNEGSVSDHMKECIMAALVEDREQQLKAEAARIKPSQIPQRHLLERA